MFGFFKKKVAEEARKPREFVIPEFANEEILALLDDSKSRLGHYRLWKRVMELVPEPKEGNWGISTSKVLSRGIVVVEELG